MTLYDRRFSASPGRTCPRCGADLHAPDPPHLCADLQARYDRQAKVLARVVEVLRARNKVPAIPVRPSSGTPWATLPLGPTDEWYEETALEIIKAIAGIDLGV